jgi:hypothetical protein
VVRLAHQPLDDLHRRLVSQSNQSKAPLLAIDGLFAKRLVYFNKRLVYFAKRLVYFNKRLVYFNKRLVYFAKRLVS